MAQPKREPRTWLSCFQGKKILKRKEEENIEVQKKKCGGYDSRFNSVIESEKAPTKSASLCIYAFLSSLRCRLPDPHRTKPNVRQNQGIHFVTGNLRGFSFQGSQR